MEKLPGASQVEIASYLVDDPEICAALLTRDAR